MCVCVCVCVCLCLCDHDSQDAHGLAGGTVFDVVSNKEIIVPRSDKHYGGVPCESVSLLLGPKLKANSTCIQDRTGVTGKGYRHEREFLVATEASLAIEEQAVCVCVCLCVCVCVCPCLYHR